MTLTRGTGPFSRQSAGVFNFTRNGPAHTLFWDPSPKRLRAVVAGETVLDSRRAKLLFETGLAPTWYVPEDDVRMDLLQPTGHHTHCPFKGDASYWTLAVGGQTLDNVVWGYPEPVEGAPPLAGHLAPFHDRMGAWFEEDDQVIGHPRDPYTRIDVCQGSQHVVVRVAGEVVAESRRPRLLFETGLPARYYLPAEDVTAALTPTPTSTICPYKGVASYWSLDAGGTGHHDVVWGYPEPFNDAVPVQGYRSFLGEGVAIEADGRAVLQ